MELAEFVSARLDEMVTDADGWHWESCARFGKPVGRSRPNACSCVGPARVLAQVEAMRRIVAEVASMDSELYAAHLILRALASIWRDHESYDPAWEA